MPRMAVPLPVSGEIVWVEAPDFVDPLEIEAKEKKDAEAARAARQGHQVSGMMQCVNCGQGFGNTKALQEHVSAFHKQASGQDDMREVEMPDGTIVPAFKVHELKQQETNDELSKERAARMQIEAQLQELQISFTEMQAVMAEQAADLAAEKAKPKKLGRPTKATVAKKQKLD